jgi:lipopolysaccharide heptosyltransferase I
MIPPPGRLLVIKPSSFGDIVHSLPVLAALRRAWPMSRIDWLVKAEWSGLLQDHPLIDELVILPRAPQEWPKILGHLRGRRYDMVIDLQGLLRSALLSRVTAAPIRAGFANGREGSPWFYTHRVAVTNDSGHAVERYLDLVRGLGIAVGDAATFPLPEWKTEQQWADRFLDEQMLAPAKPLCVIHPAARWKTKQWPTDRYAEVADWLMADQQHGVILVAGRAQETQVAPMIARMKAPAINLVGRTTLPQLAAVLRKAALLITNDSGPMHLAAALGTPVVAIFGPTDPAKVGPYGSDHIVLQKAFDCTGCTRTACVRELQCLEAITVEDVRGAVQQLTRKNRREGRRAGADSGV